MHRLFWSALALLSACSSPAPAAPVPAKTTEPQEEQEPAPGARPSLGAMPDYTDMERMLVQDVVPDSPAAKAGVHPGDVIIAFDGHDVGSLQDYSNQLRACKPGQKVTLTIERAGKKIELTAVLGVRSQE